jgi:hypothetical protein
MDKEVPDLPYVLRPRGLRAGLIALVSAVAVFVVPTAAQAACPTTPTIKAFKVFNDNSDYSLVPNGGFEVGTGGWSLSGARVAFGNEPWSVRAAGDSKSLAIDATGSAVSPTVCIDVNRPTYRFFARRTSGSWGVLNLRVRWQDSSGHTNETTIASLDSNFGTAWGVSSAYNIASLLGLWNADQDATVQLVFDPENYGGNWAIDDVYVDPYVRG